MGIFSALKRDSESDIYSPVDGQCITLDKIDDEIFSKKILGDGVAIVPQDNVIKSPIDGKITHIFNTKNAYGITADNGLELLVHVGTDTMRLDGNGFQSLVSEGDTVEHGTPIAEVDLSLLKQRGYKYVVPVIITNTEKFSIKEAADGNLSAGSIIMKIKEK